MDKIKDVVQKIFLDLQSPENIIKQKLIEKWEEIVGPRVAKHTKPILEKEGQLRIWVDQSVLAYELKQRYQQSLLKRINQALGSEAVKTIRFYVGQIR